MAVANPHSFSGILYLVNKPLVKFSDKDGIWVSKKAVIDEMRPWGIIPTDNDLLCTVYAGDIITKETGFYEDKYDWRYNGKFGPNIRFPKQIPLALIQNLSDGQSITFNHERGVKVVLTVSQSEAYSNALKMPFGEMVATLVSNRTLQDQAGAEDAPPMMDEDMPPTIDSGYRPVYN